MIGPQNIIMEGVFEPRDIGVCMVAAFEGVLGEGKAPKVCQTVRFIPHHCMMGKVHGGIIVLMEGRKIRIEGIDLKVWSRGQMNGRAVQVVEGLRRCDIQLVVSVPCVNLKDLLVLLDKDPRSSIYLSQGRRKASGYVLEHILGGSAPR